MFAYRQKLARTAKALAVTIALFGLLSALPNATYAQKNKNATSTQTAPAKGDDKRVSFDTSKIVWPNPPAIARIQWKSQFTGEKIDPAAFKKGANTKQKQKWMDRLAGTKTQAEQQLDIPFQLLRPFGIAVDSKGKIYVADQSVGAVFIFNTENTDVQMIRNKHEASFGLIYGLAIDDNDRLFVTDLAMRHVAVFDAKHKEETSFGAGVLGRPGGIAIDTENRFLYVVDTENDVVAVFDADTFKLLRKIGTPGKKHTLTAPGTFSLPSNVAVDKDGNVFVTDTFNDRVEIFDADGNFISTFGKAGDGPGYFERPKGIAVDPDGHIWVVDSTQDRVQVFDQSGRLLIYFGEHGEWPGMFMQANDIAIDKQNRVFVSEQYLGRVQMFRYVTDAEAEEKRKERDLLQGKTDTASQAPKKDAVPVAANVATPATAKETTAAAPSTTAAPTQTKPASKP
jgi:DNA-binding beta-propeller fold protein YncE